MTRKERTFISAILLGIIIMVLVDLSNDDVVGIRWWHLLSEASVAIFAIIAIFLLMRDTLTLKHSLESERKNASEYRLEAEKWRAQSKKYLEGLSQAIETQLTTWKLTNSEKEVAFLLLKGLSLKEIAEARQTTEKTARAQSISIYAKASLGGRSELAAFFLEDLLLPNEQ